MKQTLCQGGYLSVASLLLLTHFHSTLFRDFSMSFTQMHLVFPPRFFHRFLLSFGVSCFSRFSRCDVHKIQFLLRNEISPFLRSLFTSPHQPHTHTHLALRQFESAFGCAFVGVCVSVCVMSHLFYDSVPDFKLIPCCLVLATFPACPANDKVSFTYAGIKVALIPKQSWGKTIKYVNKYGNMTVLFYLKILFI